MKSGFLRILACAFIICLLIPVLIHSTKRGGNATHNNPLLKLPPMITIGPESSPYALTQREQDKLSLVIPEPTLPDLPLRKDHATINDTGDYTGITEAELKKLQQIHRVKNTPRPVTGKKPVSTIEVVPREPGATGLTEAENTKLEAWKKSRAKTPQTGRSQ